MVVLLNGVKVGLPYMANNGQPVFWNALYNGVQVWPPAAETLVDVWLKPVDFTSQALYADHPEVKVGGRRQLLRQGYGNLLALISLGVAA